jgi:hypothetical protein
MPLPAKPPASAALVGGPYKAPKVKRGSTVACLLMGEVEVDGLTDAPIPWPYVEGLAGNRRYPLFGDLAKAIRAESVTAVCWHWGIGETLIRRYRKALGVPRFNAGTRAIWVRSAAKLHTPEALAAKAIGEAKARGRKADAP